ncbi:MAG: hypothetical protein JXR67_06065 [Bacteroidales bacterium]|nr:hypothetical protein [Bacteroidales bacterium]
MVSQANDGSFHLKLEEASCYSDQDNPSANTAEWVFVVPNPGSYKVWLSSATTDTVRLNYTNKVKISLLDRHLEKVPECDKIIKDCTDVSYPYFRTDSYMGSLYFPESGEYNLQVISEKITSGGADRSATSTENTRLMSLILEPLTR